MIQGNQMSKLGIDYNQIIGKSVDRAFEGKLKLLRAIDHALQGEKINKEIHFGDFTFSINISPVFDDSDQVLRIILICSDITQKKEEERILLENELRFRTLFNAASDAIFMMDNKTFVDCKHPTTL